MSEQPGVDTSVDSTTKCETCDQDTHDAMADDGCIEGDYYTTCSSECCYGLCEYAGYCPCTCHERDAKGRLVQQLRPSVWPGAPIPRRGSV